MTSIGQKMYKEALKLEGLHERTNKKRLTKFIRQAHEMDITKTAWCAALVNALLERQGIEGTGKLTARSLLNVGTSVKNPRLGDIVVITTLARTCRTIRRTDRDTYYHLRW